MRIVSRLVAIHGSRKKGMGMMTFQCGGLYIRRLLDTSRKHGWGAPSAQCTDPPGNIKRGGRNADPQPIARGENQPLTLISSMQWGFSESTTTDIVCRSHVGPRKGALG